MKRIHYASGSLITGDEIASVLVRYAAALAGNSSAAEVSAPVLLDSDERGEVILLLGPASQMMAEDVVDRGDDLQAPEFVQDLEQKLQALGPLRADYVEHGAEDVGDLDLGYL